MFLQLKQIGGPKDMMLDGTSGRLLPSSRYNVGLLFGSLQDGRGIRIVTMNVENFDMISDTELAPLPISLSQW